MERPEIEGAPQRIVLDDGHLDVAGVKEPLPVPENVAGEPFGELSVLVGGPLPGKVFHGAEHRPKVVFDAKHVPPGNGSQLGLSLRRRRRLPHRLRASARLST